MPRAEHRLPAGPGAAYDPAMVCGWAQDSGMGSAVIDACRSQLGQH
ncbi:hypothetical protein [Streptomyces sp. NPDC046909]